MTTQDVIKKFEIYKDDTSELATQEEVDLANKILDEIYNDGPWEWLRKSYTGNTTEAGAITAPGDFRHFMDNWTDDDTSTTMNKKVVFVGPLNIPYQIIPMQARIRYAGLGQYAYYDKVAGKIKFLDNLAQGTSVTFDYQYNPTAVTISDTIPLPEGFEHMVYHGMAVDDDFIQMFEKARAYTTENQTKYNMYMTKLRRYNNSLINL